MTETDLLHQIRVVLPKYLTPEMQEDLWREIRRFPNNASFYLPEGSVEEDLLQGDGWRGLVAVNVETLEQKRVAGLLISNSCDIDLSNERTLLPRVLFAPILSLNSLEAVYQEAGRSEEQLESFLATARRQEVTNIFYLPTAPYGPDQECIVVLDDIHQQPIRTFVEGVRTRVFRLNQFAFWTLLIKLSIHFSRFNEEVARYPDAKAS